MIRIPTGGRGVVWGLCMCWAVVAAGADPLLWLRMEEGIGSVTYDASAYGRDAELRTGAAWTDPGARWSTNAALRFDGLSNHAVAANFPYPDAFVLSFWFRCTNNSGTSYQYLYGHGVAGETNSLNIYLGEDACSDPASRNVLRASFREASAPFFTADLTNVIAGPAWRHYRLEARADGRLRVFLDGQLRVSKSRTGSGSTVPSTGLFLGGRYDLDPERFFQGELDEIKVMPWPDATGAFYVAVSGEDVDDGSLDRPWRTIGHAADLLNPGDTVLIRSGSYSERVRPSCSGNVTNGATNWIVFAAYPGESPVLNGQDFTFSWGGLFELNECRYLRVEGLEATRSPKAGFFVQNSDDIVLTSNETYDTGCSGLYVYGSDRVRATDNRIRRACNGSTTAQECITITGYSREIDVGGNEVCDGVGLEKGGEGICVKGGAHGVRVFGNHVHDLPNEVGIYVGAVTTDTSSIDVFDNRITADVGIGVASEGGAFVSDIRVYNNVVYDCPYDGITVPSWLDDGMRSNIWIVNNTVYGCGRTDWYGGIVIQSTNVKAVQVHNNLCASNSAWQIRVRAGATSETLVTHNLIASFRGWPGADEVRGESCIEADPALLDAAAGDFRLKYGSPALDQGADVSWLTHDFSGRPRIAPPDIGAYEYDPDGTDSDADTMPDGWEIRFDLNPTNALDAGGDSDLDAFVNADEYGADTDPTDSNSILRLTALDADGVCWTGGSNVFQSLEKSDALFSNDWKTVFTNRPPTPLTNRIPIEWNGVGFYRLRAFR